MLHLLLLHLSTVGAVTTAPEPSWVTENGIHMFDSRLEARTGPSRWSGSGGQLGAGVVGGLCGMFTGALVGAAVGGITSNSSSNSSRASRNPDESAPYWSGPSANIVLGFAIGAGIGEIAGTGLLVSHSAADDWESRGSLLPMAGAASGLVFGMYGGYAVGSEGGALLGGLLGSSIGAVLIDRLTAREPGVSVSAWSPRAGLNGARLSMAF